MKRYLSLTEVAQLLGVSKSAISSYNMPEPDVMVGHARGWTRESIEAWNNARPRRGVGGRPKKSQ